MAHQCLFILAQVSVEKCLKFYHMALHKQIQIKIYIMQPSRTPDKLQLSATKLTRLQRSQRTVTTSYKPIQTDRNSESVKSPLLMLLLLKKKVKARLQFAFLKLSMTSNRNIRVKIVTRYLTSILTSRVKFNQAHTLNQIRGLARRSKDFAKFVVTLSSWFNMKARFQIKTAISNMKINACRRVEVVESGKQDEISTARFGLKNGNAMTTGKKNQANRSLEIGNKSVSASKLIVAKKIGFDKEEQISSPITDLVKIKRENEELKLMQLSEDAREALKKVQRFDRFFYAQETEKTCRQVLNTELKRLQKIKNSQKDMRGQYYDNELTITALHNHIKLIHEMNRDLGDLTKFKQLYDEEESKRKQEEFTKNMESKRSKSRGPNTEQIVKQSIENIEGSLVGKQFDKARNQINIVLAKYQKQEQLQDKLVYFRSLSQLITNLRDSQKCLEEVGKVSTNYCTLDVSQVENANKIYKSSQREIAQLINKYSKQQKNHSKLIYPTLKCFESINAALLPQTEPRNNKGAINDDPVKGLEKQLQKARQELAGIAKSKGEYEAILKYSKQFEKKVAMILQKFENRADVKRDLDLLRKDKNFSQTKPFSDFFALESIQISLSEQAVTKQIENVNLFITNLVQIYSKQKQKPQARAKQLERSQQNFAKKYPGIQIITGRISELLTVVKQKGQEDYIEDERTKRVKTEGPSSDKKSTEGKRFQRLASEQSKDLKHIGSGYSVVPDLKNQKQSEKQLAQVKKQLEQEVHNRTKLEKQITLQAQATKNNESLLAKLQEIIAKMQGNAEWAGQFENLRKERSFTNNRYYQVVNNFYVSLNQSARVLKQAPQKIQKYLSQVSKLNDRKMLTAEKRAQELHKINEQTIKADPKLEQLILVVTQWMNKLTSSAVEIVKEVPKKVEEPSNYLPAQNKRLNQSLQNERSRSKSLADKIKQLNDKIVLSDKQSRIKEQSRKKLQKSLTQVHTYLDSSNFRQLELEAGRLQKQYEKDEGVLPLIAMITRLIRISHQKQKQRTSPVKQLPPQPIIDNSHICLELLQRLQKQANSKQFLNNDNAWSSYENTIKVEDKVGKAILKLIRRLSLVSREKLAQERKLSQRTIKSYQNELEKLNKILSQTEMKLSEKDHEYEELFKTFTQQQTQLKRSSSLRTSRKSFRSNSSQKQTQKAASLKASINVMAHEERQMLQKLNLAENQRKILASRSSQLEKDLSDCFATIEQLKETIKGLRKNITDEHASYQREYQAWRQKSLEYSQQIEETRRKYETEIELRQQQILQRLEKSSKQREDALQAYHKNLVNVQNQLSNEVTHLREQLKVKTQELNKANQSSINISLVQQLKSEIESRSRDISQLNAQISTLRGQLRQSEDIILESRKQCGLLQQEVSLRDQRINSFELQIRRYEQSVKTASSSGVPLAQVQDLRKEIERLNLERNQIISNEVNVALKNQEQDFNRFLAVHDGEIEAHFFSIIIPEKIREALSTNSSAGSSQNEFNLRQQLNALHDKIASMQRIIDANQRKLEEQSRNYQSLINEATNKYNLEVEKNRQLSIDFATLRKQSQLAKTQIKTLQSSWQAKLQESTRTYQHRINQITIVKQRQTSSGTNPEQVRALESRVQQWASKYNEEAKVRASWESQYNQLSQSLDAKIQQAIAHSSAEISRLNGILHDLDARNAHLIHEVQQRERFIRQLQQNNNKEVQRVEAEWSRRLQDCIASYEQQMQALNTGRSTPVNSQSEDRYRELKDNHARQVGELQMRLREAESRKDENELLKQVISNQKVELSQLEVMLSSLRETRDQNHKHKEGYFQEIRLLNSEKDREILRIRAEYESHITRLTAETTALQTRIKQASLQYVRPLDNNHIKVMELESLLNSKGLEIKQLEELNERRRREFEEEHLKLVACDRDREDLRVNCGRMENHIIRLESDITYLDQQLNRYKSALHEQERREHLLRNDLIRVKTESDVEESQHLKGEITALKEQIMHISSSKVRQIQISEREDYDNLRIKKMINDVERSRGLNSPQADEAELQILRRINQEVTQLVAANRQWQTKCALLESHIQFDDQLRQKYSIVSLLQDRMEGLVNFLLDKGMVDSPETYSRFMTSSQECLSAQDYQGYFNNWFIFMKSLFVATNELKSEELRQKAEELLDLKQQMNQILDKHIEFAEDENYETLEKYKMIFSDLKILLREYINTGNQECIEMVLRSFDLGGARE